MSPVLGLAYNPNYFLLSYYTSEIHMSTTLDYKLLGIETPAHSLCFYPTFLSLLDALASRSICLTVIPLVPWKL